MTAVERRNRVQSLLHGLAVLDMFSEERTSVTVAEIAVALGVHRSSASRTAATLAQAGYLRALSTPGRYELSGKLIAIGALANRQSSLVAAATEPLASLAKEFGETAHLGILEGTTVLTLHVADGWQTVRMHSQAGKRSSAHCSAMGKTLLAGVSQRELHERYAEQAIEALTSRSISSLAALEHELDRVRAAGVAVDAQELEEGLCCVAAPVFDVTGQVVASVGASGPAFRFAPEVLAAVMKGAQRTAAAVSAHLGASPSSSYPR